MNGLRHFRSLHNTHSFSLRSSALLQHGRPSGRSWYSDQPRSAPAAETSSDRAAREALKTGHSKFIAEAPQAEGWTPDEVTGKSEPRSRRGRLLPTSSHLFKLVLPLPSLRPAKKAAGTTQADPTDPPPPTVFLLHPSQPLSHIARLIQASLPSPTDGPQPYTPRLPTVSFQNLDSDEDDRGTGQTAHQWADSTDIGDFVKEAVHSREFTIVITPDQAKNTAQLVTRDDPEDTSPQTHDRKDPEAFAPLEIPVSVPSFEDRTRFLRRRLDKVKFELKGMQDIKDMCDAEARRGARRLATGGFLALLTYWMVVLRFTFFTSYGWDTMEPVTYLTEFLAIMGGYAWFLQQGREVSYTSILNSSVSTRRRALYTSKGLDIERWAELVTEEKAISREVERIREDYEGGWKEGKPQQPDAEKNPTAKESEASVTREEAVKSKNEDPAEAALDAALLEENATAKASGGQVVGSTEEAAVEEKRTEIVAEEEKATGADSLPAASSSPKTPS